MYLWQFCAEYHPVGDHIELGVGATYPVLIEFDYGGDGWTITGMLEPGEGEGYPDSIRAIFPAAVAEAILDDSGVGGMLGDIALARAEEYYGLPAG